MELPDLKMPKQLEISKASPASLKSCNKITDQPVTVTRKRCNVLHEKLCGNSTQSRTRQSKTSSHMGKQHDASVVMHESTEIVSTSRAEAPAHRSDFSVTQFSNQLGKHLKELSYERGYIQERSGSDVQLGAEGTKKQSSQSSIQQKIQIRNTSLTNTFSKLVRGGHMQPDNGRKFNTGSKPSPVDLQRSNQDKFDRVQIFQKTQSLVFPSQLMSRLSEPQSVDSFQRTQAVQVTKRVRSIALTNIAPKELLYDQSVLFNDNDMQTDEEGLTEKQVRQETCTDKYCQGATEDSPSVYNKTGTLVTGSDMDDQIANESPLKPCMIPMPNVFPSQTADVTRQFKALNDRSGSVAQSAQEIKPSPHRKIFKRLDTNLAQNLTIGNSLDQNRGKVDRSMRIERPLGMSLEIKKPIAMQNFDQSPNMSISPSKSISSGQQKPFVFPTNNQQIMMKLAKKQVMLQYGSQEEIQPQKGFSPRVQKQSEQIFKDLRLKQQRLVQPTPQADHVVEEGPCSLNFILPHEPAQQSSIDSNGIKDDIYCQAKRLKQLKSRNHGQSKTTENVYHSFNETHGNKSRDIFPSVVSKNKVTGMKTLGVKQKSLKRLTMTAVISEKDQNVLEMTPQKKPSKKQKSTCKKKTKKENTNKSQIIAQSSGKPAKASQLVGQWLNQSMKCPSMLSHFIENQFID